MTTIVIVENKTHVLMGCDTQATSGSSQSTLEEGKIMQNGEYKFAVAGRLRMLQALKHADLPTIPRGNFDVDRFVSRTLAPAIAEVEAEAGCGPISSHGSFIYQSDYLFVVRGRVYNIHGDGTYTRNSSGLYSIGSGSTYALGALYGLEGEATQSDIKKALRAAAKHDIGTSAPFVVERIDA